MNRWFKEEVPARRESGKRACVCTKFTQSSPETGKAVNRIKLTCLLDAVVVTRGSSQPARRTMAGLAATPQTSSRGEAAYFQQRCVNVLRWAKPPLLPAIGQQSLSAFLLAAFGFLGAGVLTAWQSATRLMVRIMPVFPVILH
jgi:hypothetical protein